MSGRLLTGLTRSGPLALDRHVATHGPLPDSGSELIAEVLAAGLRGRGGAGFPAGVKLAAVAEGTRPVVIVNGTEGEPMSAKDRSLLKRTPHLVLDGAIAAARAVGAREVFVCASAQANTVVAAALAEREHAGRRAQPRFTLLPRADGYVAGEETAVLAHLEGRPPRPRVTPPRPAQQGYHGRPTLVQNVETLAHLALIARHGAAWFRELGTEDRPGSTLLTVSGAVRTPGVYEVPSGIALDEVVHLAGGAIEPARALLVGGYFGAWVSGEGRGLALDDVALRPHGAAVGAGVVVVLGESACAVAETARLTAYLAAESAGQCGPCVNGLGALAGAVERLATGRAASDDGERLVRWIEMVRRRGACAHPDGAARMLTSANRLFGSELAEHARRGPCARCAVASALVLPAVGASLQRAAA
ncbi:MAG: NADH-ubiquinone oxidoreductase-F iron-sulfur binding region domain-containing protein [Solirubrobacteraceae bacterium]